MKTLSKTTQIPQAPRRDCTYNEVVLHGGRRYRISVKLCAAVYKGFNHNCAIYGMGPDGIWLPLADNTRLGFPFDAALWHGDSSRRKTEAMEEAARRLREHIATYDADPEDRA